MLFTIDASPGAEDLGFREPLQVRLLRRTGASVLTTDSSTVLVDDVVAQDLRESCPKGLITEPVLVWAGQPEVGERLEDMNSVLSKHELHLLPSSVTRRKDGTIGRIKWPFVLDDQPVPSGIGVFMLAENRNVVLFTKEAQEVLRRHAPRLRFANVRFSTESGKVK